MMPIAEVLSVSNIVELVSLVWMEVTMACLAALVWFTVSGVVVSPKSKRSKKLERHGAQEQGERSLPLPVEKMTPLQLAAKALREGRVCDAIVLLQELPETLAGYVPANIAPRLLMAVARAPNFNEAMVELKVFEGKIESRSLEAVVLEAEKNQDMATCRQLQTLSNALLIPKSARTMEALAHVHALDIASLRILVVEAEAPLSKGFAAVVLEACAALHDIDLALDVFEKVADADAAALRAVTEKASKVVAGDSAACKASKPASSADASQGGASREYGSKIKACGQAWDVQGVWDFWGAMKTNNVHPTSITLGCMVEALVVNGCTVDAWQLVRQISSDESSQDLVNTVIYSTLLKGFSNAKDVEKVMDLYEEMRGLGVQPNTITYNTILNAFAQGGAMDRVPALLEDMKMAMPPVQPDIVTYSTIVKGFCNSGSLDRGLQILKEMKASGKYEADELIYNSLLDGCAREHRPDDALKLLGDMKKSGVTPSNYTLSMLVKLMGRCKRLNQAFTLVEDIRQEYGLKVNIQVYTCLIQACFNNRQASKAVALHEQIIKEGLLPDEMTYTVLMKGCLQAGLNDRVAQFKALQAETCKSQAKGKGKGSSRSSGTAPWRKRD